MRLVPTLRESVRLGPLTQRLISGARWKGQDQFPAWQDWADDVEAVLSFLQAHNQLDTFLNVIQKARTPQHRNACLSEARGSFFLARHGFGIVEWEPPGEGTTKGEALVSFRNCPNMFVEIKQPGWEGEHRPRRIDDMQALSPEQREKCFFRMRQEKYIHLEGGAVGSHQTAMDVVRRNALPKLSEHQPNLVIVVDDLKVSPVGLPSLTDFVTHEFANPDHDPNDPEDVFTYERLGGVLFLNLEASDQPTIEYRTDFVLNPGVLPACGLPSPVRDCFFRLREESRGRRQARYAGLPSIFDILNRRK